MAAGHADLKLFIGGEWVARGQRATRAVINPATGVTLGELPVASNADLDRALEAAQRSFPMWRAKAPHERGRILRRAAELMRERTETIARLATQEEGKTLAETRWEVALSADILEWYAEEGRRAYGRVLPQRASGVRMTVLKEPVGPVAAFAPWNFPIGNPARKIGAALGAGCPCILKPAEEAPASALEVARALVDAGLPPGVLSVVFGVPAEISSYLLASPVIRAISFTGSIAVGKQLTKLAAEGMKRTTMELGGHAPVLVFDDVDVDQVLDQSIVAKYRNAGQVCVSPTRFYVHESIHDRFVEGFAKRAGALRVGDGLEEGTQMGPLAHSRRIEAMETLLGDARERGARFHTGGSRLGTHGYFWQPTVLSQVGNDARIMNEEPFGPVALINPFSDFDAVMQQANRLPYGLAAFAFTRSSRTVNLVGEQIEAGMVGINSYAISVPESPFGGVKESGHGSEEGIEGLEACLVTKFVSEA
ncbi:MAG TPA: NAD-dependent succinate-semialdehyde dehydrogenase [Steroidobacteraceae bacterium]|nr:NAD-dependent succinate-semialdehyde dehydrogenase [Steroidobacteraceae bacterium]